MEEVTPNHRIVLPCHHEDSNLVYRVTRAAFYLSNSGGQVHGENQHLKKDLCALPIELRAHQRTRRDSNPEPID